MFHPSLPIAGYTWIRSAYARAFAWHVILAFDFLSDLSLAVVLAAIILHFRDSRTKELRGGGERDGWVNSVSTTGSPTFILLWKERNSAHYLVSCEKNPSSCCGNW
jgi:hypothetical protein